MLTKEDRETLTTILIKYMTNENDKLYIHANYMFNYKSLCADALFLNVKLESVL